MYLISAAADFIRRYASYVTSHFNWSLLIAIPSPPPPSKLDRQLLGVAGSESFYLKWGKKVKVLKIPRPLVDMNVILCNLQTTAQHFSCHFMAPTSKKLRGHIGFDPVRLWGGRVVQRCWVNFQCRGVLLIWIIVGQGPIALAIGAGRGCLDIFSLIYHFSFLSPSLWETARYRLKYCLKGPLNPEQPTNQLSVCPLRFLADTVS